MVWGTTVEQFSPLWGPQLSKFLPVELNLPVRPPVENNLNWKAPKFQLNGPVRPCVFARLPVSGISKLRLLSKNWKREIESRDSEFSHVLEETVYPSRLGLISWTGYGEFWGMFFDVKSDRCHDFHIDAVPGCLTTVSATDGGLICFVSKTKEKPLLIIVLNPLTKKQIELPCLLGMDVLPSVQPKIVQLIMDAQKQHYKVFVAGFMKSGGRGPFAQVYDSKTKGWTVVGSGQRSWDRIHGCEFGWSEYYGGDRLHPCVYDFAEGRLQDFGGNSIARGSLVKTYTLLKNGLFVLHTQERAGPANLVPANDLGLPPKYYISEYHLQKNAHAWVKVETHNCSPLDDYSIEPDYRLLLHACNGFLMVFAEATVVQYIGRPNEYYDSIYEDGWLYDLSIHKWRELRGLPELTRDQYLDIGRMDMMCELRWNAVP